MPIPIEFTVDGRPYSVNGNSSVKKAQWQLDVLAATNLALRTKYGAMSYPSPYGGNVTVKIFYFPHNRQYQDVDNGLKHTIDAFKGPLLTDDRNVGRLITERFVFTPGVTVSAPVGSALTLLKAMQKAAGLLPTPAQFCTAVKVEYYIANNGALW